MKKCPICQKDLIDDGLDEHISYFCDNEHFQLETDGNDLIYCAFSKNGTTTYSFDFELGNIKIEKAQSFLNINYPDNVKNISDNNFIENLENFAKRIDEIKSLL